MDFAQFDSRPIIVAIAGPNGAGKTTFYEAHLRPAALPLVNADTLAREMDLDPYAAARIAASLRHELVKRRESFVFETVFSDPVGDKMGFLKEAVESGYTVLLCYIGISGPDVSEARVAMRVSQGGHDVPSEKLASRFPRTLANLKAAIPRTSARPHLRQRRLEHAVPTSRRHVAGTSPYSPGTDARLAPSIVDVVQLLQP